VTGQCLVDRVGNAAAQTEVTGEGAVAPRQAPASQPLVLGNLCEERRCLGIVQREKRESSPTVEARGGTRRAAAEPSGRVVEQDRPA
jgi:hypothetical protein